ncbi:hypothetical protein SOVF_210970, partial [Spinacia oleracea]
MNRVSSHRAGEPSRRRAPRKRRSHRFHHLNSSRAPSKPDSAIEHRRLGEPSRRRAPRKRRSRAPRIEKARFSKTATVTRE